MSKSPALDLIHAASWLHEEPIWRLALARMAAMMSRPALGSRPAAVGRHPIARCSREITIMNTAKKNEFDDHTCHSG